MIARLFSLESQRMLLTPQTSETLNLLYSMASNCAARASEAVSMPRRRHRSSMTCIVAFSGANAVGTRGGCARPAQTARRVHSRCAAARKRRLQVSCSLSGGSGGGKRKSERETNVPNAQKYAHLTADERAEMIALDQLASGWIGTSIARWEWWERIKARRERLRARTTRHERDISSQIDELRTILLQLDTLLGLGLVERDSDLERISVLGWAMVLAISFANFVVAYSAFHVLSNVLGAVLPSHPF